MDHKTILAKLESREPLFEELPAVAWKRIMGTESEYGVLTTTIDEQPVITSERLPFMLQNGGEVYEDCGHVEYASPETANPVAAVAYYEAGKVLSWNARYSPELYCNNNDWCGNSFGAHENYLTTAPPAWWPRLIPFLVARTVFCGTGWLNRHDGFEISQRAHVIQHAQGIETTAHRPILNMRREPLVGKIPGWERLHIICGDATMSEVATLLRLGTTGCMVEMLEMRALPQVKYDSASAPDDIQAVSRKDWILRGITQGPHDALELLMLYYERAASLFSHRDLVTDIVLAVWKDTVEKLARDPFLLWRRLDWVAKMFLLRTFREGAGPEVTADALRSQDMAYHSLNPAEGLYYYLAQAGEMERVVSNALIMRATHEPPLDTRAFARGKVVQLLENQGRERVLCAGNWDHLAIIDAAARGYPRVQKVPYPRKFLSIPIPNPRKNYAHLVAHIQRMLA